MIGRHAFTGVKNYRLLLDSTEFKTAIINTLIFVILYVPINIVISLGIALWCGPKIKLRGLYRTIFFIPAVTPVVANAAIFSLILASNGLIDSLMQTWFGVQAPNFLVTNWAMPAVVMLSLWQGFGYNMLVFSAALDAVPASLTEAAAIDGAGTVGLRDAHRVEAGGDEEAAHLGRLAEDELVVRGEALRPVVELLDPGVVQRRDPLQRTLHQHREVVPVLVEQLELERVGQLVRGDPGLGLRLEAADDQAADLLLEVGVAVRVAQDRQVAVHALDLVGDDVEVLGRVQRDGDAAQGADRLGPLAGAVDDDLGLDVAVVGDDTGDPAVPGADAVTRVCSKIRAPRCRAPRARDCVTSVGLAVPSSGSQIAPSRSSVSRIG